MEAAALYSLPVFLFPIPPVSLPDGMAYGAFVENHPFVAAVMAGVYRMIDRAVTDTLVVHHLYYFGNGTYIFLCFSVQFHICDVTGLWLLMFLIYGKECMSQIQNKVCDTIPYELVRN